MMINFFTTATFLNFPFVKDDDVRNSSLQYSKAKGEAIAQEETP
jgi:hypothetical protein